MLHTATYYKTTDGLTDCLEEVIILNEQKKKKFTVIFYSKTIGELSLLEYNPNPTKLMNYYNAFSLGIKRGNKILAFPTAVILILILSQNGTIPTINFSI